MTIRIKDDVVKSHFDVFSNLPEIVSAAKSQKDDFEPVQVITLQQYYKDLAYEKAWEMLSLEETDDFELEIEKSALKICSMEHSHEREFVEIFDGHVIIGINSESITEKEINKGLLYLVSIDDFVPGEKYEFGDKERVKYEFSTAVSPIDN